MGLQACQIDFWKSNPQNAKGFCEWSSKKEICRLSSSSDVWGVEKTDISSGDKVRFVEFAGHCQKMLWKQALDFQSLVYEGNV